MSDVVVTVPRNFIHRDAPGLRGLAAWIAEGDAAGDADYMNIEWEFTIGRNRPSIEPGERVYVVCEGKLRGYAPLIRVEENRPPAHWVSGEANYALIRGSGTTAVAVTVPWSITGFRGFRYRWWNRTEEVPFPDWRTA